MRILVAGAYKFDIYESACADALRATDCAVPEVTAVEMVLVPLPPEVTVTVVGLALIEKSLATTPPQPGNLNEPIRVLQLKAPFAGMYSVVYQKVQSSAGSTTMLL